MLNSCKLICILVFFALCPYFVYVVGFVIKHFISTTMLKSMRKYMKEAENLNAVNVVKIFNAQNVVKN